MDSGITTPSVIHNERFELHSAISIDDSVTSDPTTRNGDTKPTKKSLKSKNTVTELRYFCKLKHKIILAWI